jgi:hypothetical protein
MPATLTIGNGSDMTPVKAALSRSLPQKNLGEAFDGVMPRISARGSKRRR